MSAAGRDGRTDAERLAAEFFAGRVPRPASVAGWRRRTDPMAPRRLEATGHVWLRFLRVAWTGPPMRVRIAAAGCGLAAVCSLPLALQGVRELDTFDGWFCVLLGPLFGYTAVGLVRRRPSAWAIAVGSLAVWSAVAATGFRARGPGGWETAAGIALAAVPAFAATRLYHDRTTAWCRVKNSGLWLRLAPWAAAGVASAALRLVFELQRRAGG